MLLCPHRTDTEEFGCKAEILTYYEGIYTVAIKERKIKKKKERKKTGKKCLKK